MRLISLISLVILFSAVNCTTSKTSKSGDAEKQFVSTFLSYMDHQNIPNQSGMKKCISPSYLKKNGLNIEKYKVNNYTLWGSSIEYYVASDGLVVAKIWGENKNWIHELEFKVVKEDSRLYLMPSKHSDAYIDPWHTVKLYVK
ncbi:MAG TPA: hypothetical protein PKW80_03510 [Bacteroidales bacterium]|nr:hypothetical protein [Bacteroidales bacterium]